MTLDQQATEARERVHAFIDARVAEIKRLNKAISIRDNRSLGQRVRWMKARKK